MSWLEEIFGTEKPIIAMCHLNALPGDPLYDQDNGLEKIVRSARRDLHALQDGGVDAVMFSNENSRPYMTKVEPVTVACMARIIGELMSEIHVPHGVDVLWDAKATIDLAAAVEAKFVREVFTGAYAGDFGIWDSNCGDVIRHRRNLNAANVRLLFNVYPESATYLSNRALSDVVVSTLFNTMPDGVCISGLTAGARIDPELIKRVREVAPDIPIIANTGLTVYNLEMYLPLVDGAIVGTTFKREGITWNPVDQQRVSEFMDCVRSLRQMVPSV